MEWQSISQVSKEYDISARMLRYYEQIGLIKSRRNEDNAYRVYDESALKRIQQIIILRKLQIPVKQICSILDNPNTAAAIELFKRNIAVLNQEISALSTIRTILESFVFEIEKITAVHLDLDLLTDDSIQRLVASLPLAQKNTKEKLTMNDLNKAAEIVSKLRHVRVIYLPPMTVASVCFAGEKPQDKAWQALTDFVKQSHLLEIKPDLRIFRFDNSDINGSDYGGHEIWVSVPDDFDIPAPFIRKKFLGGQYAAHVMGDDGFKTWLGLQDWINESDKYQFDPGLTRCDPPIPDRDGFGGMNLNLEEVLNFYNNQDPDSENQVDFLLSIKNYQTTEEPSVEIPDSIEKCGYKASLVTKSKFRIMGFTKIMTSESSDIEAFENEVKTDGRLEIMNQYRKAGAPILGYGSHDLDSQTRGGWRWTICLAESDVTDVQAFMEHGLYVETIDASKWVIFEYTKGEPFDDHSICMKLGYKWNGVISGSFMAMPDGKIGKPNPEDDEAKSIAYCWYPVK